MTERDPRIQLSVIIPVGKRFSDVAELYARISVAACSRCGSRTSSSSCSMDRIRGVMSQLDRLSSAGNPNIIIVSLSRPFGESTALMAGLERASGDVLMTLPAYHADRWPRHRQAARAARYDGRRDRPALAAHGWRPGTIAARDVPRPRGAA